MQPIPKIVVFDLDETLGYFVELGIFWDCLDHFLKENGKHNHFKSRIFQ